MTTTETTVDDHEILWVDPQTLIIGPNVRTDVHLDKGFVADIKERGVRQPVPVHRDDADRLVVQTGQKRVLAAIEAGLDRIRVLVEPQPSSDEREQTIARILDQLGENEHRAGIGDADEARATQQLLDLGLTAGQIARRRHVGTKRVRTAAAAAVARNQLAMDAVTGGQLDLSQAAVVAEFADDQAAVDTLLTTARSRPDQFDHHVQRLRDARDEARLRSKLTAQLTEQGVTVVDRPDTLFGSKTRRLSELRATPDTEPGAELTTEQHNNCPGHAAFLEYRGSWKPLDERIVPVWVCTDFPGHGHAERYAAPGVTTTGRVSGPMTEQQKAERREVIANNKAWDSATTVRRTWLSRFLARKAAPADAARWIAQTLAHGSHDVRKAMESDHPLAIELLGLASTDRGYARLGTHTIAAAAANASPARATTLTLAMLLAALEQGTSRHTWRSPTRDQIAYFQQLCSWKYPLADVEALVLTHADTDPAADAVHTHDDPPTPASATTPPEGAGGTDSAEPDQPSDDAAHDSAA